MAKPPAYQFYPKDCDTDEKVRAQDDREFGFFVRCLNHSWLNVGLPAELPELARVLSRSLPYVKKLWVRVGPCFVTVEGRLYNPKQEKYRAELLSKSEGGKAAAEVRWNNIRDASASIPHGVPHCVGNALRVQYADAVEDTKKKPSLQTSGSGFETGPELTIAGKTIGEWVDHLYGRHPKKKNRVLVEGALAGIAEKWEWRAKRAAVKTRDELFQLIDSSHSIDCISVDWTKEHAKFCPKLDEWLEDEAYTANPARASPKEHIFSDYPKFTGIERTPE